MSETRSSAALLDTFSTPDTLRRARRGVTAIFMVHAAVFASWTAHIPHVRAELGLSNAASGTALLGAPLGSVVAMFVSRWLLPRWGSHRMTRIMVVGYAVSGVLVGQASSLAELFATLVLWGLFQGGLDVAMNTQGVTVEKALGRPIMARLHGMWSVGGFIGALVGAAAVGTGIGLSLQLLVIGAAASAITGCLARGLLPDQRGPRAHQTRATGSRTRHGRRSRGMAIAVLGGVSCASMLCEGASADWSATYLSADLGAPGGLAGLAYAGYTLAMVGMRLGSGLAQSRVPARRLLPALAVLPVVGMTATVLTHSPIVGLIGFASMGVGVALVVPSAFSAAGVIASGPNAGSSIATVAAMGWIGYVCGPPVIGHIANLVGLRAALVVLPVLASVIVVVTATARAFAMAPEVGPPTGRPDGGDHRGRADELKCCRSLAENGEGACQMDCVRWQCP